MNQTNSKTNLHEQVNIETKLLNPPFNFKVCVPTWKKHNVQNIHDS